MLAHPEPARRAPLRNRRGLGKVSCRTGRRLRRGAGAASSQHLVAIVISDLIFITVYPTLHRSSYPPCHPPLLLEQSRGPLSMLCRYLVSRGREGHESADVSLLEGNTNKPDPVVCILLTASPLLSIPASTGQMVHTLLEMAQCQSPVLV